MPADFPRDLDRVCMYLRKSRTDIEAEARGEGETLSKHRKALMELANHFRYNVRAIYQEIVSGERIADRPEMQKMLQEVEAGKWQAVLCMDLDRLGRGDMIDQGTIFNAFKDSNTLIITPRKVYDLDDELDEEWSEFEAFMARRELKIITRRLQRGRIASVKEGKYIGTRPPFGYDKSPEGILIPNKDAEIVKMIFNWYVNGENGERMGSTKIARRLNEMGIKSNLQKKEWEPSVVLFILQNEVYIGRIQWRKTYQDKSRNKSHARPREEWIDVQGKHEPIIDEELFYAAQEIMKKRTIIPSKKKPRNPLAGLIICGKCGRRMVMNGGAGRVLMIACVNQNCNNKSTSYSIFEEKFLAVIEEELKNLELKQAEIEKEAAALASDRVVPAALLTDLETKLAELQKQKSRIQDLLEQGVYDVPTYIERNRVLSERIDAVKKSLSEVEKEISEAKEREKTRMMIIPTIRHVLDAYRATNDVTKKNALLKTIIEKAVYIKDKSAKLDDFTLDIHFRI